MENLTILELCSVKITIKDRLDSIDGNIKECQKYNLNYEHWETMKISLNTALAKLDKMETQEITNLKNLK